jgi:hypothetical protein
MLRSHNALRWDGSPGHYEAYYLTLTDPASGVGLWIRYTMLAPRGPDATPTAALWFVAIDPDPDAARATIGRRATFPIDRLHARREPFGLRIDAATLGDDGMTGAFADVSWDLRWRPDDRGYAHVHPVLGDAGIADTVLVLPHADLSVDGEVGFAGRRLELSGARGGQAHVWGVRHARRWAWAHCNDFRTLDGAPVPGAFVDGVSAVVSRSGRELGPSTPVLARIDGQDFRSASPFRLLRNASTFALTGWRFEAVHGARRLVGEVDADRGQLAGVTYHDPDGEPAYCYNSETASMRLRVYERARRVGGWAHRQTLVAPGRAHFEYGQRSPVPGQELVIP